MKKLLGLLSSIGLVASTGISSVVSCGTEDKYASNSIKNLQILISDNMTCDNVQSLVDQKLNDIVSGVVLNIDYSITYLDNSGKTLDTNISKEETLKISSIAKVIVNTLPNSTNLIEGKTFDVVPSDHVIDVSLLANNEDIQDIQGLKTVKDVNSRLSQINDIIGVKSMTSSFKDGKTSPNVIIKVALQDGYYAKDLINTFELDGAISWGAVEIDLSPLLNYKPTEQKNYDDFVSSLQSIINKNDNLKLAINSFEVTPYYNNKTSGDQKIYDAIVKLNIKSGFTPSTNQSTSFMIKDSLKEISVIDVSKLTSYEGTKLGSIDEINAALQVVIDSNDDLKAGIKSLTLTRDTSNPVNVNAVINFNSGYTYQSNQSNKFTIQNGLEELQVDISPLINFQSDSQVNLTDFKAKIQKVISSNRTLKKTINSFTVARVTDDDTKISAKVVVKFNSGYKVQANESDTFIIKNGLTKFNIVDITLLSGYKGHKEANEDAVKSSLQAIIDGNDLLKLAIKSISVKQDTWLFKKQSSATIEIIFNNDYGKEYDNSSCKFTIQDAIQT